MKSNKYGGGKAPKQAHMVSIWQCLLKVAQDMEHDPEFLLNSDYFVFDEVSASITNSCRHYRESTVSIHACIHTCIFIHSFMDLHLSEKQCHGGEVVR